jgi:hypothetical protein
VRTKAEGWLGAGRCRIGDEGKTFTFCIHVDAHGVG